MLISTGKLTSATLRDHVAIVTGAGQGIGFEAARSLAWLGARVVVAELDASTGAPAAAAIQQQFGDGKAIFIQTDVGSDESVANLKAKTQEVFGGVDIVINNATVSPLGAVQDRPIQDWDASYRVNLRGPVLLAQAFLPEMIGRKRGVFVCISSVGHAFMGAYECFKTAQVHLAETLDAELDGTGVFAFAIGPGLVMTPAAEAGITEIAPMYGKTFEEFCAMSEEHIISLEEAGAGFAAAVALAEQFSGQEISSKQALIAAGLSLTETSQTAESRVLDEAELKKVLALCRSVRDTLAEQSAAWAKRSIFERQWMVRDFRKNAGMPVERWLEALDGMIDGLSRGGTSEPQLPPPPLEQLAGYYAHLQELAAGYEKDPEKLEEQLTAVKGWQDEVERLNALVRR
jgi:NAD(P)-dependent dehydrogenase (short-subunit alcohol dehydrogenase family)